VLGISEELHESLCRMAEVELETCDDLVERIVEDEGRDCGYRKAA
jgi:hypothetical protein